MTDCGCQTTAASEAERRVLRIALGLNATMFIVGAIAGWIAHSMGLIADSLDMLADAMAYGIALAAWSRTADFKASAARFSGTLLLVLGIGILLGALWRIITGSNPDGVWMIGVAFVALLVNATVLRLLQRFRNGEVHLRATWLFTRVDVIANLAVIAAGGLVWLLNNSLPDLVIGVIISRLVIKEALGILRESRRARAAAV
jgi:cation diffusion facilitator family transporter